SHSEISPIPWGIRLHTGHHDRQPYKVFPAL
ncbi:hypothetical protein SSYM_1009, partial [Serratia symbiotica str. Tucson]